MQSMGKFFGVGVGPGNPDLLTVGAVKVLSKVQLIFSAASVNSSRCISGDIIKSFPEITAPEVGLKFAMSHDRNKCQQAIIENSEKILSALKLGKSCAFVTIGDPLTYSTYGYLIKKLLQSEPQLEIKTIPGINSWSALAAECNEVLVEGNEQPLLIFPAAINWEKINEVLQQHNKATLVLMKSCPDREQLLHKLKAEKVNFKCLYGANIGLNDQFVSTHIEKIISRGKEYLSLMIVKNEKN